MAVSTEGLAAWPVADSWTCLWRGWQHLRPSKQHAAKLSTKVNQLFILGACLAAEVTAGTSIWAAAGPAALERGYQYEHPSM